MTKYFQAWIKHLHVCKTYIIASPIVEDNEHDVTVESLPAAPITCLSRYGCAINFETVRTFIAIAKKTFISCEIE